MPTALELVEGKSKEAVQAIVNMLEMRRGFFGPPNLDSIATQELRSAISAALSDPELIAESKQTGLPLLPSDGQTEQAKISQITGASQTIIPILQSALESVR